jgi:hypothetical protein
MEIQRVIAELLAVVQQPMTVEPLSGHEKDGEYNLRQNVSRLAP